ncbi:CU044_5270 family protein [Micromonospora sp. WMMD812]|uniref:CU044_5270 family protein n=1 Tax=Micromonospora sp. WMMD812 TaxID=3015152 RepID=UPI00248B8F01|nr:CU044_5270 family protein [Micromonospora sp. WMMD812]WBB71161.1 CU044_5270 family protein [Micromonospora sp. WMMD812]
MLRDAWSDVPPPSPATRAQARAALLARAAHVDNPAPQRAPSPRARASTPWRLPRLGWRVGVITAAVAAVVGGLTVVESVNGPVDRGPAGTAIPGLPAARPASAAEALERAASAAGAQSFTAPRPDQWIHVEERMTSGAGPGGLVTGGPYRTRVLQHWMRADGRQVAWFVDGKFQFQGQPARTTPPSDYPTLAALPTDPDALLQWLHQEMGGLTDSTEEDRNSFSFGQLNAILRNNVLPPGVEAAIYRAMAKIPNVTLVPDAVNVDGRPAIALGRVQGGWLREEVLLDPDTHRLIGERAVAIKDYTAHGLDGTVRVKSGTVQRLVVTNVEIVDRPEETG